MLVKIIITILFAIPGIAFSCPPGSVQLKGNGWEGCTPLPQMENSNDRPKWKAKWGAVVTDGARAILGVSVDADSESAATQAALDQCHQKGGIDCKIDMTYSNQCVSLVSGESMHFTQNAPSIEKANRIGMRRCVKKDKGCEPFYAACSFPSRQS